MNITRIMLAAAMTAGLGVMSANAAQANVTATIDIVNNNTSTTIYHAKNPPSTQSDMFSPGRSWSVAPPNSILAGASDATAKIVLGPSDFVEFTYGSPNLPSSFSSGCTFRITANSAGTGLASATGSKIGSLASCAGSLPSGQPYNVKVTVAGF